MRNSLTMSGSEQTASVVIGLLLLVLMLYLVWLSVAWMGAFFQPSVLPGLPLYPMA